ALANASQALVNNIDMTLTTPSNSTVLPWVLDPTPTVAALNSPATHGVDNLNNMEQVTIDAPAAGNYTVNISGTSIPQGPQRYYVVYEFVNDAPIITYPIGGEPFDPGTTETIRWDAYGNTNNFALEYSTNGGASWTTINSSVAANRRYYNWVVPNVITGQARVRVTRNAQSSASTADF